MHPDYGHNLDLGACEMNRRLVLMEGHRDKHLYIAGATGTGKSKLLESLVRQDIIASRASGSGLLLIDPHGALYDSLVTWMTLKNLHRRLILIDLREADWVVSYNVLRRRQANPAVIVENFVQAMAHVWGEEGTDKTPLFARWAGNTLSVLYEQGYTLSDAIHLLGPSPTVRAAMTASVDEPIARSDWESANALKPKEFDDQVGSTVNRLRRFLKNKNLRCVFGQQTASLDLGKAIDEGAIVLVSLAREKGRVSREDADLFATLLLTDLWTAAQERGKRKGLKPFYLYLDEFQRFVSPTISENLDEARGFGLHLTLAHQFPKQLLNAGPHGKRLHDSVMENASSKIVFRLTDPENLEVLAKWLFMGVMDPEEIKHEIHSTKVLGYREEMRTTKSRSHMRASAYAEHESTSDNESSGESGLPGEIESEFLGTGSSNTAGATHSHQEAHTTSESESHVLIPEMGTELSQRQYRCLDEQTHRAMQRLFAQAERNFTVRLAGMRAPVSMRAPDVEEAIVYPSRVREYVAAQMTQLPFVLSGPVAMKALQDREARFADELLRRAPAGEPTTSRRRKV